MKLFRSGHSDSVRTVHFAKVVYYKIIGGQFHSDQNSFGGSVYLRPGQFQYECLSKKVPCNSDAIIHNVYMDIYIATKKQEKRSSQQSSFK